MSVPTTTMLSRRSLLQILGVGAGVAALAACAPSGGAATSPTSAGAATTGAAAENFSFASWSLSEENPKPVIQGLIDQFAAQDGITVSPVTYPYNEYLNQLTLQIRGGQFAGAAQVDVAWLGSLAALGKLQDLSGLAEGRGYTDSALRAAQYDGTQYGLPWTVGAIGLIGNSDLLGQVGISELPSSVEDFEAALVELQGIGGGVIPYAASTKVAQLKDVLIWMETFGSPLLEDGKVTIGDDASIEAVTWYKKLYDQKLIAADVDRFDARSLFSQGKAALYDDAIVGRGAVVADSPDPDLGSKLVPFSRPVVNAGDDPRALVWGHAVVVAEGDGAGTAAEFAQWLTSDEKVTVDYFSALGLPPTTEAGLASAPVQDDEFTRVFGERITATATPNPFWVYPQYAQVETAIAEQVQAALVGQKDPATAMKDAGEAAQKLIG
ncbi:extracellular solute-binding protein [Cellulosimicrobium sp. PMB13]|uniref:extracellular solute-binding protein n=1 Tax=Cellulosimicrobium sp. PMB13 TaxID=3120158 RepID=UPI003F4AFF95